MTLASGLGAGWRNAGGADGSEGATRGGLIGADVERRRAHALVAGQVRRAGQVSRFSELREPGVPEVVRGERLCLVRREDSGSGFLELVTVVVVAEDEPGFRDDGVECGSRLVAERKVRPKRALSISSVSVITLAPRW